MALYLGGNKVNINLNKIMHSLKISSLVPVLNSIPLMSSENFIPKDSNGTYIITQKEDE